MTFGPKDADAWYLRNKDKLDTDRDDPVFDAILDKCNLEGGDRVFEFGCANGWRLQKLIEWCNVDAWGSELSPLACQAADKRIKLNLEPAIASCDLVIMGFCLYLIQPGSLLYWAHYADKILADGGHLVVHDFLPESPYSRIFEHNPDLRSRKMDHGKLWLAHPGYSLVVQRLFGHGDDRTHVSVLKKDMSKAFPLKEIP